MVSLTETIVDAYRNKMRSTLQAAQAATTPGGQVEMVQVAPHLETRAGKRKWNERGSRRRGGGTGMTD